jgi:hypothetical protein
MVTAEDIRMLFGLDTLAEYFRSEDETRDETPQEKMQREIDEWFPNGI